MAKELTGCGKFLVWAVCPAIAAAAGYFLIGPRVGSAGIGERVPVIRSLGQELARKVKGEESAPKPNRAGTQPSVTPPPTGRTSDGTTEFQRIREQRRAREAPRNRRAPIDSVE